MPTIMPRLDVARPTIDNAKRAKALREKETIDSNEDLKRIRFSDTLALAVDEYLEQVLELLDRAGFRRHPALESSDRRPRRIDPVIWERLEEAASRQGVSRIDLVRAVLTLLGDEISPRSGQR